MRQRLTIIKKYKVKVLSICIICAVFIGIYYSVKSYLHEVIEGSTLLKNSESERSVTGDEIALTYTKESGVVISYTAQRTQTEDDTILMYSYFPRLVYTFANENKLPVHIRAEFGSYHQEDKVITFEQSVIINYGSVRITAPYAKLLLDTDMVLFSQGAVIEDKNIVKARAIEWNIVTNKTIMSHPIIYTAS